MKEYMDEYFDAYHILLENNYRTWDPHLCHWSIFGWSLEACMHLANGSLLTWRYKHFHGFLVRHVHDVHFYYVVMYFDDIYYVLMMIGIMNTRKWDLGVLFPNGMGWRALLIVGVQCKQWELGMVFSPIDFKLFGKQVVLEMDSPFNKVMLIRVVVMLIRVVQQEAWWFLSKIFMESQGLKVDSSVETSKNHTESRFFNNHV